MIMPIQHPRAYSHTCSESFLDAIKQAIATQAGSDKILAFMAKRLELEFPEDLEMRAFATKHLFQIAKLLLEGKKGIGISRTLSHGLEIHING